MKKIYALTIGLMAFCCLSAQVPTEKTLLWKISGKGITKPSYLFGTIHLMCADQIKIPTKVTEAFANTSNVYLEIAPDADMMKRMMTMVQMTDGSTLQGLLGKAFDTTNKVFESLAGFPLKMMNTTKPIFALTSLYPVLLGCSPASWESRFQELATKENKPLGGLETIDDQMSIFDKIPYARQAEILHRIVLNKDSSARELTKLVDLYKSKDIAKLNQLTVMDDGLKEYEDILLTNRNNHWIPIIGEKAKAGACFFAFGAGHLGGTNGVVNLLRKAGYTVTPVLYE